MTIKTTELLKLFTKANQLDLTVEVREDDGDYVIRIYEMFRSENFDKTVFITQDGKTNWDRGIYTFDAMMDILDERWCNEIARMSNKDKYIKSLTKEQINKILSNLTVEEISKLLKK